MNRQTQNSTATGRSAFTLLELLAVIVIISILISLVLPAISGVLGRADVVAVRAEISQLEQSLTAFRETYGEFPPSSIVIPNSATTWSAKDQAAIRKFWPQFNFATLGGLEGGYPANPIHLNGAECLVFFLGGVDGDGDPNTGLTLSGFAKNPVLPWLPAGSASGPKSENRVGPFLEFDAGRVVKTEDITGVYMDPMSGQTTPILYLSGSGRNMPRSNTLGPDAFDVFDEDLTDGMVDARDLQAAYTQADGSTVFKKDTFQLIAPGEDGLYGNGGAYSPDEDLPSGRAAERDNITNFANGTLE